MNYLIDLGFTETDIDTIFSSVPSIVADQITLKKKLVEINTNFLRDLGVENYKELFVGYSEIFLQEPKIFKDIFLSYDREDLIRRLKANPSIIIRL